MVCEAEKRGEQCVGRRESERRKCCFAALLLPTIYFVPPAIPPVTKPQYHKKKGRKITINFDNNWLSAFAFF